MLREEDRDKKTRTSKRTNKVHVAHSGSKKSRQKLRLLPNNKPGLIAVLVMLLLGIAFSLMIIVVNVLPPTFVFPLLIIMVAIIVAVSFLLGRKGKAYC